MFNLCLVFVFLYMKEIKGEPQLVIIQNHNENSALVVSSITVTEGDNIMLKCILMDNGNKLDEETTWGKQALKSDIVLSDTYLHFTSVRPDDQGVYFCENSKYNLRKVISLIVTADWLTKSSFIDFPYDEPSLSNSNSNSNRYSRDNENETENGQKQDFAGDPSEKQKDEKATADLSNPFKRLAFISLTVCAIFASVMTILYIAHKYLSRHYTWIADHCPRVQFRRYLQRQGSQNQELQGTFRRETHPMHTINETSFSIPRIPPPAYSYDFGPPIYNDLEHKPTTSAAPSPSMPHVPGASTSPRPILPSSSSSTSPIPGPSTSRGGRSAPPKPISSSSSSSTSPIVEGDHSASPKAVTSSSSSISPITGPSTSQASPHTAPPSSASASPKPEPSVPRAGQSTSTKPVPSSSSSISPISGPSTSPGGHSVSPNPSVSATVPAPEESDCLLDDQQQNETINGNSNNKNNDSKKCVLS